MLLRSNAEDSTNRRDSEKRSKSFADRELCGAAQTEEVADRQGVSFRSNDHEDLRLRGQRLSCRIPTAPRETDNKRAALPVKPVQHNDWAALRTTFGSMADKMMQLQIMISNASEPGSIPDSLAIT